MIAFAFLMNGVGISGGAHAVEDRHGRRRSRRYYGR